MLSDILRPVDDPGNAPRPANTFMNWYRVSVRADSGDHPGRDVAEFLARTHSWNAEDPHEVAFAVRF